MRVHRRLHSGSSNAHRFYARSLVSMPASLRNVLMIVPAFPPDNTSATGRPMHFARNLPEFGYWPLVLVQTGLWSYPQDHDLLECVEGRCEVFPAGPATGWPFRLLKDPLAWCINAIRAGLRLHAERRLDLIWATSPSILHWYPAMVLSRMTARPLVLDVRDPVTYGCLWNPRNRWDARARRIAERVCMSAASRIVHASPLTMRVMGERAGPRLAGRMVTILNGFSSDRPIPVRDIPAERQCTFLYAGKLERGVREPRILLEGLKIACRDPQFATGACLEVAGGLSGFAADVAELGVADQVRDLGYRPRRECLARMAGADVLVLLQTISGPGSDVISGKAYEYLAARRPILGVVSDSGGDAWLLRNTRSGWITGLAGAEDVAKGFLHFWRLWQRGALASEAGSGSIDRFDRRNLTRELAQLFDEVLDERESGRRKDRPPQGT